MSRKTYFRMPNFDHAPNRDVQLGQIITSPRHPYERLEDPLPIEAHRIDRSIKTNYLEVVSQAQKRRVGLWVQFLASFVGIGGDIAADLANSKSDIFEFRELEATFFEPDSQYLKTSLSSSQKIKDHIDMTPGKSLYMITGVKTARGARSVIKTEKALGIDVKLGVDATVLAGVPAQGGPAFSFENARGEVFQFGGASDFVFAYRLLRIIPKPKGNFKTKRHEKGAETMEASGGYSHDVDSDREPAPTTATRSIKNVQMDLDSSDYGTMPELLPFEMNDIALDDDTDGAKCVLIIPTESDD